MRKALIYSTVLLLAVLLGYQIGGMNLEIPENKADSQITELENISQDEIIDLRNNSYSSLSSIEKRPVKCHNQYSPWDSLSKLNCTYTEENLSRVNLIADAANYIDNPLGKQNYESETYSTGGSPWDLEFLPNGSRIISYKGGTVEVRDSRDKRQVGNLKPITKYETGLLGLAVDPKFRENRFIYLYYTYQRADEDSKSSFGSFPVKNRISRFKLQEDLTEEEILINNIPGTKYHSGGRLEFGPDGKLYATTGEAGAAISKNISKPENLDFLGGKILRMNKDGTVPEDNPFSHSYVYSRGHRNPQGLAWNPENGDLYSTEHGSWRKDEINHITPGDNYGWAETSCGEKYYGEYSGEINTPVKCYRNWTMAPSGSTFVHNKSSPWYGDMFVAGLRGKHIARLSIENNTVSSEKVFYFSKISDLSQRLRDVEYYNGSMWIIGDRHGMVRLTSSK